jgi:hypothetical protein
MTVKSLRSPWRAEILSNRTDSFFYSLVGVWRSLIALSPLENRTWSFWWDTLLEILDWCFQFYFNGLNNFMKYRTFKINLKIKRNLRFPIKEYEWVFSNIQYCHNPYPKLPYLFWKFTSYFCFCIILHAVVAHQTDFCMIK